MRFGFSLPFASKDKWLPELATFLREQHRLHLVTDADKAVLDAVDLVCEGRNGLPTDQITWRPVAEAWRAKQLSRRGEKA